MTTIAKGFPLHYVSKKRFQQLDSSTVDNLAVTPLEWEVVKVLVRYAIFRRPSSTRDITLYSNSNSDLHSLAVFVTHRRQNTEDSRNSKCEIKTHWLPLPPTTLGNGGGWGCLNDNSSFMRVCVCVSLQANIEIDWNRRTETTRTRKPGCLVLLHNRLYSCTKISCLILLAGQLDCRCH